MPRKKSGSITDREGRGHATESERHAIVIKEKIGQATDDPNLEDEGRAERTEGDVEETVGKVRRKAGEAVQKVGKAISRG